MDFELTSTPEERDFRRRLSEFLDRELTEEVRRQHPLDKGLGPEGRAFMRALGAGGWLGIGWPQEYGGSGGTLAQEIILSQEFARREAYIPNSVARLMAGPVILRHGSEQMRREFLPRIAAGEIEFGLGYTEPSAGSDLAAMRMRAVRDEDHFVISGQKIFNTQSHYADYHWLAARTDPDAVRHKAISLFVVDQRAPGITIGPIETLGGERTNTVFYDEVRVHESRLVGEVNRGFYYMVEAIEHERLMLSQTIRLRGFIDRLIRYARETTRDGRALSERADVRRRLAQIEVEYEAAACFEKRALYLLRQNATLDCEGTVVKLVGSELRQRIAYAALDILGPWGRLEEGSKWAPLAGEAAQVSRAAVVETIGGGTSEVLRNVVAVRSLGLPRGP
ncbi:MAG: acyl-CoA dehydrogenase family protein [Gammaproteobacteria bacterium]|nr:acyl-CoA dehydrogenase family protein [Gammaproteobacteria bacterium]